MATDEQRFRRLVFLDRVHRWSVVNTTRQQTVAEHSHRVAVIAKYLAGKMEMAGRTVPLVDVLWYAISHDESEALSGDIPTPMKRMVPGIADEEDRMAPPPRVDLIASLVVKTADILEAALFLSEELHMGNRTILKVRDDVLHRAQMALVRLFPQDPDAEFKEFWNTFGDGSYTPIEELC
jgi:5'-deoxynucleotidase YfbR-like HD superfamily hydrolase